MRSSHERQVGGLRRLRAGGAGTMKLRKVNLLLVVAVAVVAAGCGASEPDRELSPAAAAGREVAVSSGCTACHGDNGEGSVGPAWVGLAGSTVELEGGGAVVADTEYLRRAIVEPQAEIVAGMTVKMPLTELSDEQVDSVIAYIEELR